MTGQPSAFKRKCCNMQFEHTIMELCVYLLGVGIFRQGKTAAEALEFEADKAAPEHD